MIRKSMMLSALVAGMVSLAPAQTAPTKVGTINIQGAILGTKDGQKAAGEIDAKFGAASARRKTLEAKNADVQALRDKLQKVSNTASTEERERLAREVDSKQKALQRDVEDAQAESEQEQQKLLNEIGGKMMQVIERYSKDKGYAMILDVSSQQTPVIYGSPLVDVTTDIVALYDQTAATMTAPPRPAGAAPGARTPGAAPRPTVAPPK